MAGLSDRDTAGCRIWRGYRDQASWLLGQHCAGNLNKMFHVILCV